MPLYEYSCANCGARFDTFRSIKEADAPIDCRACGSQQTQRALSKCNASSAGRSLTSSSNCGCGSCSGGSCSSCGH